MVELDSTKWQGHGPSYGWYGDGLYDPWREVLPSTPPYVTVPPMGRAEVIEYTEDFDGGDSTSIRHVYYNHNTNRMTVQFITAGLYSYDSVSHGSFAEFRDAESLGKHFREVFRRPGNPWPGAKHDERTASFRKVDVEYYQQEPDVDVFKQTRLTAGKGDKFILNYTFKGRAQMEVRAPDIKQAIALFEEFMREKGFEAHVDSVNIRV